MLQVKHNAVWKDATPYVKVNGVWVTPQEVWAKDAGAWKLVWPEATLSGQDLYDFVSDPSDAFTAYQINSNGKAQSKEGAGASYVDLETWLKVGANSLYQVKATQLGSTGTGTRSGTLDTWLACTSSRSWSVERAAIGTATWSLKIDISRVSDSFIVASCTVNLTSEVDSGL